ncbi:MAG: hypothetical protein HYS57_00865 [Parcubacteria group bacterium]|nr:hypothetical protein [Parcubacteria group bacterium]
MKFLFVALGIVAAVGLATFFIYRGEIRIPFNAGRQLGDSFATVSPTPTPIPSPSPSPIPLKQKPDIVKALYYTSWSAGTPSRMNEAIRLAKETEINAVVIDVKDFSGKVTFSTANPLIKKIGSEENRVGDFITLVNRLHQEGIYVIVRIAVFQDQHLLKVRPDLAVRNAQEGIWRDHKGLGWVDPGSKEVWEYNVEVAREAAKAGVDELNFDYIRFPSDGKLENIKYTFSDLSVRSRRSIIREFFAYLHDSLKDTGAKLSVDLFGLSAVNTDDLGIGQVMEDAFPYFDFVSPMVYPSHYAAGFIGYKNPGAYPYEVIKYSLDKLVARRNTLLNSTSTPTIKVGEVRPWLQAFDLGAEYTPYMINREKQAVYDSGLTKGWFLWSPSNKYNPAALSPQ